MATGQYIGVNGVARKVTSPYIGVEGVARNVISGYVGVNGVARLFFAPDNGVPAVLQVETITSDTYANNTTYTAEEFILLDIYPKTGGRVKVTYGGLTKTITDTSGAEEPNAQQVYFGTFNGVTDSVATPASGELTIEGDYYAFAAGIYISSEKGMHSYCTCITGVANFGALTDIPNNAFKYCSKLCIETFHEGLVSIGEEAFFMRKDDAENAAMYGSIITLPSTLQSIGARAFTTDEYNDANTYNLGYLAGVKLLATTPPTIASDANPFGPYGDFSAHGRTFSIIVPKGCGAAYKAADWWRNYDVIIVEEP